MDRNLNSMWNFAGAAHVALRKESVDRNGAATYTLTCRLVALRKESVDRNGG